MVLREFQKDASEKLYGVMAAVRFQLGAPPPALLPGGVGGSQHTVAQRGTLESGRVQQVQTNFLQVAFHFLQFAKDEASLLVNLRLAQRAVLHHLRQQLDS